MADTTIAGSITTGLTLHGTLGASLDVPTGTVVTGNEISGQMVGGPKGADGHTPVKGVDYTDGVNGTDGREVELQNNGTHLQWRYTGGSWTDLVALASLMGADGQEVSMQVSGGYIQWRLGTGSWTNLIALSALTGADGREVEMHNSGTAIQWRYVGDTGWTDVVALSALKGDKGDQGISVPSGGSSGQTLLKNSSTDYDYSWATPPSAPVTSVNTRTGDVTGLAEQSALTSHTGNTSNPHSVTKAQVGLGSADNTADASKNVLSATKLTTARTINGVSFDGSANITVADSTKVPTTTTVNGKALSANITLTNTDVGAAATSHTHVATTDLTATGTKSSATYLRGDNTWNTPTNTTYNSITGATISTTTATVTLTTDRYQIMNYTSGKLVATLPATAAVGAVIEVFGLSAGGFRITAPSGDNILYPNGTDSGSAGYIEAPRNATVTLRCVVANTTWMVTKATLLITNNSGKTMPIPPSW